MRANLFGGVHETVLTVLVAWALFLIVTALYEWAVRDAVWFTTDSLVCRRAAGACWAVIVEKHRVMLFGTFPYEEHWRGVVGSSPLSAWPSPQASGGCGRIGCSSPGWLPWGWCWFSSWAACSGWRRSTPTNGAACR